jgi:hypothetical protein
MKKVDDNLKRNSEKLFVGFSVLLQPSRSPRSSEQERDLVLIKTIPAARKLTSVSRI